MVRERQALKSARHLCPPCVPLGAAACLLALMVGGCGKEHQMQKVAKDWCTTIRASQIIPVYGLTEDLQPGDIFLVQVPLDKQQQIYRKKGFLPLDNHIARLDPKGYEQFYDCSFIAAKPVPKLPYDWMHPQKVGAAAWELAPHVAFPTYSFSVRRGAGLNLAVPVQGVPVGLSLLGSDAADGSISIKQARTIGVDILSLYREVQEWAQENSDFLRYFGTEPEAGKHNYLRVVTRVFATGEIDVGLRASASQSGGLDAGVPKPVDIVFPDLPRTREGALDANAVRANFTNGWNTLQQMLNGANSTARDAAGSFLPGGSLRLTGVSSRTVSLKEQFQPPVILGYLGFDVVIYTGGVLGPPIPTHAILSKGYNFKPNLHADPVAAIYSDSALLAIYNALSADPDNGRAAKMVAVLDDLVRFIPATFVQYDIKTQVPVAIKSRTLPPKGLPGAPRTYLDYHSFRTRLSQSIETLEYALRLDSFAIDEEGTGSRTVTRGSDLHQQLKETLTQYRARRADVATDDAYRHARSAAVAQYLEQTSK